MAERAKALVHDSVQSSASHHCDPGSFLGLGMGHMCDSLVSLLAEGRWFSPGTPVSSTRKT